MKSTEIGNEIVGGLADNKDLEDISKKFDVPIKALEKEFEMGLKVEMEHVNEKKLSGEIVLDHLMEIPDYYTRLAKMEKEADKYWSK